MRYRNDLDHLSEYFYQAKRSNNLKVLQTEYISKFNSAKNVKAFKEYLQAAGSILKNNNKAIELVTREFMANAGIRANLAPEMFQSLVQSQAEMYKLGLPDVRIREKLEMLDLQNKEIDQLKNENKTLGDRLMEAVKFKGMYKNLVSNLTVKEKMSHAKIKEYSENPAIEQEKVNEQKTGHQGKIEI